MLDKQMERGIAKALGLISSSLATALIDIFENSTARARGADFSGSNVLYLDDIPVASADRKQVADAVWTCLGWITDAFHLRDRIYVETVLLSGLPIGGLHPPHADNATLTATGSWGPNHTPQRNISAIIYLNDAASGGEIVFPEARQIISPRTGLAIAFPSDEGFVHQVNPVVGQTRYSLAVWFTFDASSRLSCFYAGEAATDADQTATNANPAATDANQAATDAEPHDQDHERSAPDTTPSPLTVEFFRLGKQAPLIRPANAKRPWMDATDQRFAHRCTPMLIANASGWEFVCPFTIKAEWDGRQGQDAIQITATAPGQSVETFATSHFGHGIVTFHTGWLMRTSAGWATWVRGSPNCVKEGITPLEGIVETEWLPFPFTMNWQFIRPGLVTFHAGEPFCFVTPMLHNAIDAVAPVQREIDDDPDLLKDYVAWSHSRAAFNAALQQGVGPAMRDKWQKKYAQGTHPQAPQHGHLSRRQLKPPKWAAES